jgi:hypothetical protein
MSQGLHPFIAPTERGFDSPGNRLSHTFDDSESASAKAGGRNA